MQTTKYTYTYTIIDEKRIQIYITTSLLVYINMGTSQGMPHTEGRFARPEWRWGCCRGTPGKM